MAVKKKAAKKGAVSKKTAKVKVTKVAARSKSKAKVVVKKAVAKVKPNAKAQVVKIMPKVVRPKLGNKPFSKSELFQAISADTAVDRKSIKAVFESLEGIIGEHLSKGPGVFNFHGICKMLIKHRPATPARKGTNPFTGEEMMFKAKPASKVIRIRAFKKLKELV